MNERVQGCIADTLTLPLKKSIRITGHKDG